MPGRLEHHTHEEAVLFAELLRVEDVAAAFEQEGGDLGGDARLVRTIEREDQWAGHSAAHSTATVRLAKIVK